MLIRPHRFTITMTVIAVSLLVSPGAVFAQQDGTPPRITLAEQNNLASLLDFAAERLNLNIEYPQEELRRQTVTLRLGEGVTDEELWTLVNRLLAAHSWTTIQMSGETVLSVVKLADAPKQSRFHDAERLDTPAGFTTAVRRLQVLQSAEALTLIKPLLSQPGGQALELGETEFILISDQRPRLMEVLDFLDQVDQRDPDERARVERVPAQHLGATELVAQVSAAVAARDALEPRPLRGKLTASSDGRFVILVAPQSTLAEWRALISEFDQREPVETRSYAPRHFALEDVASLIEQTAPGSPGNRGSGGDGFGGGGSGGSGERWKLVIDNLTGSLIVTATPREHQRIEALMERLAAAPAGARRPVRAFVVRNRDVTELLNVLRTLIEEDAVGGEGVISTPDLGTEITDRPEGRPGARTGASISQSEGGAARSTSLESASLSLTADESTNTLIAVGEAQMLAQLESLLRILDVRQPQVELQIFVVNLSDSDTLDLGVELQKLEVSGSTLIGLSSLFDLSDLALDSTSPLIGGRGFSGVVLSPGDFSVVIRALKTVTDGSSRSYPRVVVNNNEEATLDSVRQEPFQQVNASDTVATTSFGGTLDAGTQITVTPHIAEGDHLVLQYAVTLSAFVGESSDPSLPPPRQQTSLQSVATIPDGYTVALGGLEVINEARAISQVPLLGDLPGVGELFKNRSHTDSRARFYVFIRANILRHDGFEDLKYISDPSHPRNVAAEIDDGWPTLKPRVIK